MGASRGRRLAHAGSDWTGRPFADYALDIGAAHRLLGSGAGAARLRRVEVDPAYEHWVPPGVCDNGIGYYEMPGARLVSEAGAGERSLGIASMISWRGVWYVVHFGAVLRKGREGVLDAPRQGAGEPGYSPTC